MSKIRLSFFAHGTVFAGGTLVMDTVTHAFSEISVFCSAGAVTQNVWYSQFAEPGSNIPYPAGTPVVINIGAETGITVQINYHDHGYTTAPIPIQGGFVTGVPFDILKVPGGSGETGWVAVTPGT
ncbi:MAG TPA: hypothetical protein VK716_07640 [Terracidiphilus sp.]|nr:hypothetical protein [Terracidiphilus sp.]